MENIENKQNGPYKKKIGRSNKEQTSKTPITTPLIPPKKMDDSPETPSQASESYCMVKTPEKTEKKKEKKEEGKEKMEKETNRRNPHEQKRRNQKQM